MKRLSTSALCRFSAGVAGFFFAGFVAIGTAWAQAGQPASVSQTPTVVKEGLRLNQQELAEAQQRLATASGVVAKSTTITRTPVYRFYNTTTGAHFYTASVSERNTVQATMPNMVYEGAAFDVSSSNSAGLSPVYRFYNQSNGVHFYTISEAEKNHLLANAPSMHLDGVVYYSSQVAGPAYRPLYRFYVPSGGFHFYTISESEKNNLIATNSNYQFEGAAYYVLGSPQAPSVSLSAPLGGGSYTAPASITLAANADDLDGWVTSVAFYSGTALLGTDTTAPYNFNWNNVPAGTYSVTARATDNSGAVTTSAAVTVTVNASVNQVPSVSLTAPAAGAGFTAPATVSIVANAADSDGTIASVSFYNGNTLLGTDTSAPYSYSWSNVGAGTYSVTARATDNQGAVTTSAAISVIVEVANTFPTVSLTSPLPGANFTAPATVTMVANAADANGTVTQVQFYNGATLLGADTIAPYSFDWANVAAGTYSITAVATDNQGATTTSAAVNVIVSAVGESITYIHTDISGSPLAATNASGNLVWKENYSAYGERKLTQPGSEGQKQWFHGKEADATGLQYFGARYYDPVVGRFMGVDPVGLQEDNLHSFNRYAYGNNNPVRYLDPDGNSPLDVGFLLWDVGKLGLALYSGNGAMIGEAAADVFISTVGVLSPVPGTGLALKAGRAADKAVDIAKASKGLRRPYIRNGTRREVEAAAPRDAAGRAIDPNTGRAIEGKADLGHKPGHEHWREKQKAEAEGLSQKEFNDRMNDSKKYQLEDPSINRSRRYEQK